MLNVMAILVKIKSLTELYPVYIFKLCYKTLMVRNLCFVTIS
jgi:hypothetical protein